MTKRIAHNVYQGQLSPADRDVYLRHRRGGVSAALAYRYTRTERAAREALADPGRDPLPSPYGEPEAVYQVNGVALARHTKGWPHPVTLPDGAVANVFVYRDEDDRPDDAECYDEGDIDAWRADHWHYVGVTAVVKLHDGRTGQAALWGNEVGDYWPGTERAQVWEAAAEMIDEAIGAAHTAPIPDAAAIRRIASARPALDSETTDADLAEWARTTIIPTLDEMGLL